MIKKFTALYKGSKLDNRIIIFVDNLFNDDFKKGIQILKNMRIPLAVRYDYQEIDSNLFKDYEYVITKHNNDPLSKYIIDGLMNVLNKKIILTDGDTIDNTLSLKSSFGVYTKDKIKSF